MTHAEIDYMLSCMESHKCAVAKFYEIETFELKLRFLRTALLLQHFGLTDSLDFTLSICSHVENYLDIFVRINQSLKGIIEQDMALGLSRVRSSIATSVSSQPSVKNSAQLSGESQPGICMNKECLLEFLDSILENLSDLLHWLADKKSFPSFVEQVETLEKKLKFLRDVHRFKASDCIEHQLEYLSGQLSSLAYSISCLWQTFWTVTECFTLKADQALVPHSMNRQLSYLIFKIKLIQPMVQKIYFKAMMSSNSSLTETSERNVPPQLPFFMDAILESLKELRCSSNSLIAPLSNLILNIHKELEFLNSFLLDPPESYVEQEKLKDISTCIATLTMETAIFCHRFDPDTLSEGLASELNSDLCRLLEKFQIVKEEIEEIYHEIPKPSRSLFPRTLGLGFIDHFLRYLDCLLIMSDDSVVLVKHEVETMKSDLVGLYSFLSKLGKKLTEDKLSQEIFTHIIQVAFEAENVIDSIISREKRLWYLMLYLLDFIEEIKIIKEQVRKIGREASDTIIPQVGKTFTCATSLLSNATVDEVMVGFEDETARIISQLIEGTKELDIISIVGMPGQGKTTLAKKVYNEVFEAHRFDVRAWCCVSQEYNKAKLLKDIFRQVCDGDVSSENDIADQLRKTLIGKRYIIVLDDVWKIAVFDNLVRSFPRGNNGSRVLLTTRLDEVAENAKHCTDPYHLRLFTLEESLNLLQRKLFQNTNIPPELYSSGREIVKKCHGLPLAVALVAGVLSRTDNKADSWREFTKNSISHIVSGEKHCTNIIELSYVHLPDHLKTCFLYFGAFPEDTEISVSKIIQLWIGEGFIQQTEGMSSEVVAQSYLEDLIASSLLIVSKRRSNGGIKTCCVHDLLLDFCLSKAKELHLLQLVKGCNSSNLVLSRASAHLEQDDLNRWVPACQGLRSLLYFTPGEPDSCSSSMFLDVSYIINNFRLLRVLDLGSTYIGQDFPPGIKSLIHLRYLAIVVDANALPPSLGKLRILESLHVTPVGQNFVGENFEIVQIPSTFWNMAKLRHVHINDCVIYGLRHYEQTFSRKPSKLDNLITLSCAYLLFREETNDLLRMFPNLQKLRCVFSESLWSSASSFQLPRLDLLTRLECLKVSCDNSVRLLYPLELKFPCSLKKLTIGNFRLPWSEISIITELPRLEILKLGFNVFVGEVWDMGDNKFLKLKFLEMCLLNIVLWNAFDTSFPVLERLVISSCYKLEKIPCSFEDTTTLELIEVKWCKHSLANSVLQLKDEQLGYTGYDNLKVHLHHIYPPDEEDTFLCDV